MQTLYRRSNRRELARKYIDRTIWRVKLRLGLEALEGFYAVRTEWVIGFLNFPHPRHSIGVLVSFVQTLYRLLIGRELARN